ncbi:MAG: L-aspartate oxidase [Phycisphaerae bacterium]
MANPYLDRRYLISFETRRLPYVFTDVLVIGSGIAGLRAALAAAENCRVLLVTKSDLASSNSYKAQGGMAAAIAPTDSIGQHQADTLRTGCDLSDPDVVGDVLSQAPGQVEQLKGWGAAFDESAGQLELGREGGHGADRIVHAHGDATGRELVDVLARQAQAAGNLKLWSDCYVLDLITDPPGGGNAASCLGALTWHERYGLQIIQARRTILAAGGSGMLWRETTNPPVSTADGLAIAFRAGVSLADVEFMQFHPTTLYVAGATRSLISEAVRGEGAKLLNRNMQRFMPDYHEMAELAPRDVVSRAILDQMQKTESTHVYLDVRHLDAAAFAARFPYIDRQCRSFEINPAEDLIPVHPAAHYMIGGAKVDSAGRTNVANLLACGEAACTGLHGANRLASNSLTEALVLGQRCGELAGRESAEAEDNLIPRDFAWSNPTPERSEMDLVDIRNSLRSVMWRNVGIVRRGDHLADTLEIVSFWGRYVLDKEFFDPAGWEVQNMLTASYLIAELALRRTETRGVHYRQDFPDLDPNWARHQAVQRSQHQLIVQ